MSLPARNYDLVGSVLAAAVASSLEGQPFAEALADEARRRGHAAGSSYDGSGDELERARGLMEHEGFEPVVAEQQIALRNCPFDALAKEQPELVCGVNLDYVRGALDGLGCAGCVLASSPSRTAAASGWDMMATMSNGVVVRPIEQGDHEAWQRLFHAYRKFYEYDEDQDVVDLVWGWINDDSHETNALVALVDDEVVGFAHHREFARPSSGKRGLFLDDLFTEPTYAARASVAR